MNFIVLKRCFVLMIIVLIVITIKSVNFVFMSRIAVVGMV